MVSTSSTVCKMTYLRVTHNVEHSSQSLACFTSLTGYSIFIDLSIVKLKYLSTTEVLKTFNNFHENYNCYFCFRVPQDHLLHQWTQTCVRCQITDALECPSLFLQLPLS